MEPIDHVDGVDISYLRSMAHKRCTRCRGVGHYASRGYTRGVCSCVYRHIFRNVLERYREMQFRPKAAIERLRCGALVCGFKGAEYCADVECTAKRALEPRLFLVWRHHFICERPWHECLSVLSRAGYPMDRGNFFHDVYRVQEQLGQVFEFLRPYRLSRSYFRGNFLIARQLTNGHGPGERAIAQLGHSMDQRCHPTL